MPVNFQYRDLKVLRVGVPVLYLQANPYFPKIVTQARNNIFHVDFCIVYEIFKNNYTFFGSPDLPPVALITIIAIVY